MIATHSSHDRKPGLTCGNSHRGCTEQPAHCVLEANPQASALQSDAQVLLELDTLLA